MTDIVLVLTTVPAGGSAEAIAEALIAGRLAACVNILPPMISIYRWEGLVTRDTEHQLVIKTTRARVAAVQALVGERHPYQLPEFLVCAATDGSPAYCAWVQGETTPPSS